MSAESSAFATHPCGAPVIVVTGAARRIGAVVAAHLHAAGADIVLHCKGSVAEGEAAVARMNALRADSARLVVADLAADPGCRHLIDAAAAWRGRIDGLVNNASIFARADLAQTDTALWDRFMDANAKSVLLLCKYAEPWLRRAAKPAVVNLGDARVDRPLPGFVAYSASKAALVSVTRTLALEWAPQIRVNAVAPGSMDWPEDGVFTAEQQAAMEAAVPLARRGCGEDIAVAVRFLLLEAGYVTGQVLAVDGGSSLVAP